jgi:hypothetical protein
LVSGLRKFALDFFVAIFSQMQKKIASGILIMLWYFFSKIFLCSEKTSSEIIISELALCFSLHENFFRKKLQ